MDTTDILNMLDEMEADFRIGYTDSVKQPEKFTAIQTLYDIRGWINNGGKKPIPEPVS